jgi:hypothetical protein
VPAAAAFAPVAAAGRAQPHAAQGLLGVRLAARPLHDRPSSLTVRSGGGED